MSPIVQALMTHYARRGDIRRFVIKCRVDNQASNAVARRNHFAAGRLYEAGGVS